MHHVLKHAFFITFGKTTLKRCGILRHRDGLAGVIIFLEKQKIDLRRGPAKGRLLQQNRERPCLLKISRQQEIG